MIDGLELSCVIDTALSNDSSYDCWLMFIFRQVYRQDEPSWTQAPPLPTIFIQVFLVSYYLTYYFLDIGYPIIYPIVAFAYRKVKKIPIKNSSCNAAKVWTKIGRNKM